MTSEKLPRLAVLVSGSGSNLQAIIDAVEIGDLAAEIVVVVSNRSKAFALERARQAGIPVEILVKKKEISREDYDARLAEIVLDYQPDWIILAGWMRLLSMAFLSKFPNKVINLHPALPGTFPGTHAIQRAFEAYQKGEIEHAGLMVHLVPDEGVDDGPVLAEESIPIYPDDTLEALEERVHLAEHRVLVETIGRVCCRG